ncbi:nonribosomal peptide synthase [Aspergillus flavus]|nr:nonribosomal peptide synthase [Aspergillus flavus]
MGSGDSNPHPICPLAGEPRLKHTVPPLDSTDPTNGTETGKYNRLSKNAFATANGRKHKDTVPSKWLEQVSRIASQCHCTVDEIEDIYPCTPLQEGMMALTLKDSTAYTVMYKYHLSHSIDIDLLRSAWDQTAQANPILRTRIVPTQHSSCMQVVLRESVPWIVCQGYNAFDQDTVCSGDVENSDENTTNQSRTIWKIGSPLARLIWDPSAHVLTVLMHHALCDDWSMRLLLRDVDAAYQGQVLGARPFRPLIEYIEQSKERSAKFWREQFDKAHQSDMKAFPSLPVPGYTPVLSEELTQAFPYSHDRRLAFPINAKVRLAWAILQSLYTRSDDVLFGTIDTGRGIPMKGIDELSGPALVCVPVRVQLQPQHTITDALKTIQYQYAATMEFAHIGLQYMMHLGPGPAAGCHFNTLLAVEPEKSDPVPSIFKQNSEIQETYDTYPLILRCRPSSRSLTIQATFDPAILEPQQTNRILHQLAHIYCQVEGHPKLKLSEINTLSPKDRQSLSAWNLPIPSVAKSTVPELIHEMALKQPQAAAICSWGGNLTYDQLNRLSHALMTRLKKHGVAPGVFVPLCLEKSMWMGLAMIAVMKAGGAFALLDPSYPLSRLRQMCEAVKSSLVVSTNETRSLASQLGLSVLVIDEEDPHLLLQRVRTCDVTGPIARCSAQNPMYATFTSGSTGAPKGVVVEQGGYTTSATAHAEQYNFTSHSRVLQFASPGFDSCIIEHISTLIKGGCVCVPDVDECRSRLAQTINKYSVNNVCLTPSVARILSPADLPTLQDLAFVGEAVLDGDVARWKPFVHVRNAYGPAECSAVFSVQPTLTEHDPKNIGLPTGGVGWVVHPEDPQTLMPVGSTGELLIEGPIVGPGYLSNPVLTAQSFIHPPKWRGQFGEVHGRMYKTGDLVQNTNTGSFRCLGRKDTQVKLHGQRIELGEIEHLLQSIAFTDAPQVVVDMVQHDNVHPPVNTLTAFICWPATSDGTYDQEPDGGAFLAPNDIFRHSCTVAESRLSSLLPSFMIPNLFLPVRRMPLTPSGKLDRRQLRTHAGTLSAETVKSYRVAPCSPQPPSTPEEVLLQSIWAQVLNKNANEVGITESFFNLGGDSVSAMQVGANCQAAGYRVSVADIFQFPTIAQLAHNMKPVSSYHPGVTKEYPEDTWFRLSPIQQLFFELCPNGHNRFTQQFLLRLSRRQDNARIWKAMEAIVRRHSMLRAQFHRPPTGPWVQRIRKYGPDCFVIREHTLQRLDTRIHEILVDSQGLLDIRTGILLVVDIITTATSDQYISLMAHHLVIDLVSWRVLLQDLEDFLATGTLAGLAPLSFQQWCHLQEEYVAEFLEPRKALPREVPPAPLSYWGGQTLVDRNIWAEAKQYSVAVSEQVTQAILGHANNAFRTRPVELIHAALLYSFLQVFHDRQPPTIFTEGHGREPWDLHIDLSRTVGWFTTLAPVWAPVSKEEDMSTFVLRVKEARRAIPANGWTYFSSRYLHPQGRHYLQGQSPMEILFNYTGLFQQLERRDALLELAAIPDHEIIEMPEDMPRFALIDVSAVVMNGQLNISFMYNRHMRHQARLEKWFHECERAFEDLPKALRGHRQLAPSDFPLLSLGNHGEFEKLISEIGHQVHLSEIEDIYPCSPAQIGMWLSQSRDPRRYWSRLQWSLYPSTDLCTSVSISQVKQAWQNVVDLHPILRTVFFVDPSRGCEPLQIVLKTAKADIEDCEVQTWSPDDKMLPLLLDQHWKCNNRLTPTHRLKVHAMPDNSVRCELVINHMLVDGYTQEIFLTDLQRAYDDLSPRPVAPPYSDYIGYINSQTEVDSKAYWLRYLDGVQPCLFPRLSVSPPSDQKALRALRFTLDPAQSLRDFCQHHATTIPNLFQVAWGLLLQAYTGSDIVCFGFLVSARDIPLPNAQEIAGPMINLLVSRLSFDSQELISSILSNSQAAYGRGLDNRHSPLPDIIHSLGLTGRPLFNTALSLQKANDKATPLSPSTVIRNRGGCDATEYELTLNIMEREKTIEAELSYWSYMLTELQAELIASTFQHIVYQLVSGVSDQLGQLDQVSQLNRDCIMDWNKQAPLSVRSCIHDEIGQFAIKNPSSPAVTASDGSLTYAELDQFSTILAERLSQHGVGPNVFVPLYADKSRWVVVGVLGVLKAGGAFVLLDPCHPMERLRDIMKNDIHSQLILTCTRLAPLAGTIADAVIVLEQLGSEGDARRHRIPSAVERVCPATAAYAVFTSGSSGKPKASVVGHESYVTGAKAHSKALGLAEGSRVLQFASFAFDASVMEILTTLMVGGCICIPSDKDRQERLSDFIQETQVDWALLTPSVARTLDPEKAASLKTLVLGGESLSPSDMQKWSPYVKLMSAYGPSECSVIATVQNSTTVLMSEPTNIGRPTGARAWVTDRYDSERLVPVGAVGELLIEGPIVGQGYIGRPELTAVTFLHDIPWLQHISCSQGGTLYKTGDLVRMLTDRTLIYMGRKDRQVKLRGQRIELAEVEYHVRHCFPGTPDVFADIVASNDADQTYLIAAVSQPTQDENEFASAVSIAESHLLRAVPPFMRPSFLFRLQEVPQLPSGKVDRSRIRKMGVSLMQKQRDGCNSDTKDYKATDLSAEEQALRELWSQLLHCREGAIGPEDDFFSLGGDSITAMKLVSAARTRGLHVAVADVFAHSQLRELASSVTGHSEEAHEYEQTRPPVDPFSLIPCGREAEIQKQAMIQCSVDQDDIEDIYPCTAMQAGMAALTAERAGAYVAHHEYSLPPNINIIRLRYAWQRVVTHHPILRTRLIQTTDLACWQVVLRNQELGWTESQMVKAEDFALGGLDPIGGRDDGIFGIPLFHVRISIGATCKMTLTMHHAVYDAWALPQFLHCAHKAYVSDEYLSSDPVPFQHFIEYTCSQVERSLDHWRTEFNGLDVEPFPVVPSISYRAKATSQVEHSIPIELVEEISVTRTAAVRLAWALVQAQYQSKSEIVYGVVSSGRTAPVPGVEAISGPTICAFPLRVNIDTNENISKALKGLQTRTANLTPFEHVGLQQIAKLGPEAVRACSFQTLLNVEPAEELNDTPAYKNLFNSMGAKARDGAFASYAVVLNCVLNPDSITVTATFDDQVISRWKMGHIMSQFSHILQNVHRLPQSPVRDILAELNPSSMQQLKIWNGTIPDMVRETVPGAIQQQCSRQPLAPAVCGWDGSFTYSDLDRWSNKVASLLQRRNIHPKSIIPILMDRSRWVMVAMLGIIKAGAAFVLLEPSYAFSRLRLICNDIDSSIILTTDQNAKEAQALVADTMVVDERLADSSPNISTDSPAWCPSPNDALYCVFTSGSTGKPKGIIINHGPFVTMTQEYARRARIAPDARILHFGSYAFDVSILETLSTLIAGACVCVPSEAGRKERFAEAVQDLRPSHALLTPSLARALPQNALGSVRTLMLVGEAARRDDFVKWMGKVRLMNLYGPAECTILSSMQSNCTLGTTPASIGHSVASVGWITDPRNPYQLAPIGAVGELVLQGPLLGRGYLNDPDQTAAAFIRGPAWLEGFGLESNMSQPKMYRTGDLVCYEDDGSLVYHGRKDTQAKLRGQRLELQEIEEQIQRSFPGILTDVVAEILTPIDGRGAPCLVAFLSVGGEGQDTEKPPELGEQRLDIVAIPSFPDHVKTTESKLAECLPDYMVPSIFVPLRQMPRTVGGKVDRRGLRQAASSMTRQQLEQGSTGTAPGRHKAMSSDVERLLQSIWAQALGISPENIGAEDSFFRLGGDSISAMQATSQARAAGIEHAVADLFQWKSIRRIVEKFAQFIPVPQATGHQAAEQDRQGGNVGAGVETSSTDKAEELLPCTPVQCGILLTQMQDPLSYAPYFIWKVRGSGNAPVDLDRLVGAWQQVVARHGALRAVFKNDAKLEGDGFQLRLFRHIDAPVYILPESPIDSKGLPICLTEDVRRDSDIPHQFTICHSANGSVFCRLDINHAIIDATSVSLLVQDLKSLYDGQDLSHGAQDAYHDYLHFVHKQPQEPARAYWSSYLTGMQPLSLPYPWTADDKPTKPLERLEVPLACSGMDINTFCRQTDWTASNLLYFAWAMALGAFSGSDDVCFGVLTEGRHVPVKNIQYTVGQIANMAVCRVRLAPHLSLDQAALSLQENYGHILSFQTFPLSEIARAAGVTVQELASTAINVQYALPDNGSEPCESSLTFEPVGGLDPTSQDIMLYALIDQHGGVRVSMSYRPSRVSTILATQLADYFSEAISSILRNPRTKVGDLHLLSVNDHERLLRWNTALHEPEFHCVHQAVTQVALRQPSAPAVCGFDGSFSYAQLEIQSTQLAAYIVVRGVTPATYVPLCFEKSRWTTVAMLAVMKAGATFVPLDPTHPITRLQELCRRVDACFVLTSVTQAHIGSKLADNVIVVGDRNYDHSARTADIPVIVDPEQPAYVLFTSGTTGSPKGVMIPHVSFLAAAQAQMRAFSIGLGSRVLQFSSYAFDVSVMEILTTLVAGGTVCVMSESERNRMLLDGVCPIVVTHAFVTPSIAGMLDAGRASWVETLVLLGEPMSTSHIKQWANVCRLMNAYGPTECSVLNTATSRIVTGCDPKDMGYALGVHFWVVDQNDHHRLLPIGAIGELVISGPPVGLGYINDLKRTADAFIEPPAWLQSLFPKDISSWRLYKTGDLVRYNTSDGSLRYEGRKDRQIKVRGQRVELEDIEYHTARCFPGAADVVAEQIMLPQDSATASGGEPSVHPRIVACIHWKDLTKQSISNSSLERDVLTSPSPEFDDDAAIAAQRLREVLPSFMVPDLFLPMVVVPRQKSGKTDRRLLRDAIVALHPSDRQSARCVAEPSKRSLKTATEKKFQMILSQLLKLAPHSISADDSLFHLGGDSIIAMKIAAHAQAGGLDITPHEVLRDPTIRGWASVVDGKHAPVSVIQESPAISLVADSHSAEIFRSFFDNGSPFSHDNVQSILPVLDSQSYYLGSSSIVNFAELFPMSLDTNRLRKACCTVVSQYSILRTVFVTVDHLLFQVILRDLEPEFTELEVEDAEAYLQLETKRQATPSTPLGTVPVSFSTLTSTSSKTCAFIARISHAQYDGACLPILWNAIKSAYNGEPLPAATELTDVLHHRLGKEHPRSLSFWTDYLRGASSNALDPLCITSLPDPPGDNMSPTTARREIRRPVPMAGATVATLIKAALAWLFARYQSQYDIILGQVVHGRGSDLPNIDKVFGPCVTFLPVRVTIDPNWTVSDLLRHTQAQHVATVPHDAVGLRDIVRQCTNWPEDAKFGCLVHHQPLQSASEPLELGGLNSFSNITWASSRPPAGQVDVISIERQDSLDLVIASPANVLDQASVEWMADRLSEAIELFCQFPHRNLTELEPDRVDPVDVSMGLPSSFPTLLSSAECG